MGWGMGSFGYLHVKRVVNQVGGLNKISALTDSEEDNKQLRADLLHDSIVIMKQFNLKTRSAGPDRPFWELKISLCGYLVIEQQFSSSIKCVLTFEGTFCVRRR